MERSYIAGTWEKNRAFSPAVVVNGGKMLFFAGHGGQVDDNGKSLAGDFAAQTRQTWKNIEATLKRALDTGAAGVVVPMVNTARQALAIVSFCKYPPLGHRSIYGQQPQFAFQSLPLAEATRLANDETLVILMLETQIGRAHV